MLSGIWAVLVAVPDIVKIIISVIAIIKGRSLDGSILSEVTQVLDDLKKADSPESKSDAAKKIQDLIHRI
jgi:hypothetical protein